MATLSDRRLAQKLGPEAHRQQFAQRLHHYDLFPLLSLGGELPILADLISRLLCPSTTDHVDRGGQSAELSDELTTDSTG